jgi:hypothetical protein
VIDNFAKRWMFHERLRLAWLMHIVPDLHEFLPHLPSTSNPNEERTEAEYVNNIFFFNVMGQDDASGRFSLDGDDLRLDWKHPIASHPTSRKLTSSAAASPRRCAATMSPCGMPCRSEG